MAETTASGDMSETAAVMSKYFDKWKNKIRISGLALLWTVQTALESTVNALQSDGPPSDADVISAKLRLLRSEGFLKYLYHLKHLPEALRIVRILRESEPEPSAMKTVLVEVSHMKSAAGLFLHIEEQSRQVDVCRYRASASEPFGEAEATAHAELQKQWPERLRSIGLAVDVHGRLVVRDKGYDYEKWCTYAKQLVGVQVGSVLVNVGQIDVEWAGQLQVWHVLSNHDGDDVALLFRSPDFGGLDGPTSPESPQADVEEEKRCCDARQWWSQRRKDQHKAVAKNKLTSAVLSGKKLGKDGLWISPERVSLGDEVIHAASSTSPKFRKQLLKWNRQRAAAESRDELLAKLISESVRARYPGSTEQVQQMVDLKVAVLKMIMDNGRDAELDVPASIVLDLLSASAGTGEAATIASEILGFSGWTLRTNIVMKLHAVHRIDPAHGISLADTMLTGDGGRKKSHAKHDGLDLMRHQLVLRGVQWHDIHDDSQQVARKLDFADSQAAPKETTEKERKRTAEGIDRLLHVAANRNLIRASYLSALNAVATSPEKWKRVPGSESEWHRIDNPAMMIDFYAIERW